MTDGGGSPVDTAELARRIGARPHGPAATVVDVGADSRRVVDGQLFCCVPGANVDGHDFAPAAVAAGARALLVERVLGDVAGDVAQLVVPSVRAAMGPAAAVVFGFPSRDVRVVGVTGTNGKTSTAFMTEHLLRTAGHTVGLTGTIVTRIGGVEEPTAFTTPEAPDVQRLLARMRAAGCTHAVMEVSSHALTLGRVDGVNFAVGAFTNLTQDHLDFHGTMEAYFAAKARLFEEDRCAVAVVDVDGDWGRRIARGRDDAPLVRVSSDGGADDDGTGVDVAVRVTAAGPTSLDLDVRVTTAPTRRITMPVGGSYNAANAAVAVGIGLALGEDDEVIARALATMPAVPGRFEPVDVGQDFAVVVDYAHTPDGIDNVLAGARAVTPDDAALICVFGCGGDRDRTKRPLMGAAAARGADVVVVTSDNPRGEDPAAIIDEILVGCAELRDGSAEILVEVDRRAAIRLALSRAQAGDVVVIAGKGHETGQTAGGTVTPFDDRVVAAEELSALGRTGDGAGSQRSEPRREQQ